MVILLSNMFMLTKTFGNLSSPCVSRWCINLMYLSLKKVQVDDYLFAETLNINNNMSLSSLWLFTGVTTHVPPIPPRPRSTPFMTQTSMPQLTVTLPPREQNTAQVVVNVPTTASSGSTTQNSGHPNYSMMRSYSVPTGVTSPVSMSEQQNPTHIKSLPTSPETTMDSCAESEASECTVCYERSVNAVLYTCGHMCMCFECAIVVKNHKSALCPICRQEIKDVIKIYKTWCLWRIL